MEFFAYHGYYPEEQQKGGAYIVDVRLETEIAVAAEMDELTGTVNYEIVYDAVSLEMQKNCKLIEHLAYNIVLSLKARLTGAENLEVTVHKLAPPLGGKVEETSITIKG